MRRSLGILLVGLAFVAAACGGSAKTGAAGAESAATIAPAGAPGFIAIDTNLKSDQWQAAQHLLDKFPGKAKLLDAIRKDLAGQNVDYERDVKPALGKEIDVVWLDFANGGSNIVGLTKPKDESKFTALLGKGGTPSKHEVIDGWTVFAEKQATIDRFRQEQGGDKLADDASFKEAFDGLPEQALAKAYVDASALRTAIGAKLGSADFALPGADKAVWLAASLEAGDDGVRFETDAKTTDGQAANFKSKLLPDAPSGAFLYLSFHGQKDAFRRLRESPQLREYLPQLEKSLGVSLDDIAPLLSHEGEFYVRPGTPIPEVTLAVLVDDEQQALKTVDTLVRKLAASTGTLPRADESAGVSGARVLQIGPVPIHYAAFDGKLVLTTGLTGINALHEGGSKLQDDPTFKDATKAAGLPDDNAGFLYVDLKEAIPLLEGLAGLAGAQVPADLSDNLKPLRSFVAFATSDGKRASFSTFLRIQ